MSRGSSRRLASQLVAALGAGLVVSSLVLATPALAGTGSSVTVKTAAQGKVGTILVTATGLTLYRHTHDRANTPTCTGSCARVWPPLLLPRGVTAARGGPGVHGLGTVRLADGRFQVTFHKMPLYRYAGDSRPGQDHGQGLEGAWFVVKAGAATKASTTPTTKASSGGYGY